MIVTINSMKGRTEAGVYDVSKSIGMLGIVVGLGALCGWSVLPAYVIRHLWLVSQVHPNAAFGFILVGFSLRLARYDRVTPWVHVTCKLFRISVGLLGLLSLANSWFHLNLGIDKFIVRDPTAVLPGSLPAAAALCFYTLGCALVLLSAGRILLSQIVSLIVATITAAALIANAYQLLAPQALPDYLTMPTITALVMMVLSLGMINSNANYALMAVVTSDSEGGAMARRLLPVSLLIPIVLGFLRLIGQNAGWFGPAMGLVLHVVTTMLLLALFIWWNAWALDRVAQENRHFEQAVQDTRTTMLSILDHVNNAVFGHDLQGNLTFVNAAAERLFGISAKEAKNSNIYAIISPRSAAAAREMLSNRLIGCPNRPEFLVLCTSGGEQEYEILTTLIYDRNGIPVAFFSVVSPVFTHSTPEVRSFERIQDAVNVA